MCFEWYFVISATLLDVSASSLWAFVSLAELFLGSANDHHSLLFITCVSLKRRYCRVSSLKKLWRTPWRRAFLPLITTVQSFLYPCLFVFFPVVVVDVCGCPSALNCVKYLMAIYKARAGTSMRNSISDSAPTVWSHTQHRSAGWLLCLSWFFVVFISGCFTLHDLPSN